MLSALRGFDVRMDSNNINAAPSFRQEGDMGRYVAFNDPGQPGAGFSSYQDYLDAGNSPVNPGGILGTAIAPPIVDNRPKPKNLFEGYDFMEGFQDSEFYKKANWMQQDAVEFKFDGKDMMMNSSMAGALRQYLDSIGKGDLYQSNLVNNGALPLIGGTQPPPGLYTPKNIPKTLESNPNNTTNMLDNVFTGNASIPIELAGEKAKLNNTGIGSLTQNPINTTPESNMTGSMTSSPYLNNNQDLDQYLNSYVENLINRRMRDIFGGIMSIFQ